jgi:protein involved in polysaccharide export with SLBB domain
MKRTVFVILLCLFGLYSVAWAEGPAAVVAQPASPFSAIASPATTVTAPNITINAPNTTGAAPAISGEQSADINSQQPAIGKSGMKSESSKDEAPREKSKTAPAELKTQPVEVSPIEKAMSGETSTATLPQTFSSDQLKQFGYNFFRSDVTGFAPLTDIPVGPDYIIGVGDKIDLTLWGSVEGKYELEVDRNGEITLPKVGTLIVAGINYEQLKQVIHSLLAKVFKDFELDVNIGKLRLIKVYLVGEVKTPGDYDISSLSTVINALSIAGGPTKNGSLRKIMIKRNGRLVDTVDLYDFFLKGDKSRDIRLHSGDTIFVPTIGPVAGIAGDVRKPGIYELKNEKSLKDILSLADGIDPGGYLQRIQISRVIAHEKKIVSDFNLDAVSTGKSADELTASIPVQDMDLVKVFSIDSTLRGSVRLEGYVLRPGSYALKPGMRIKDILTQDNLLPEYYQEVGEITRLYLPDYHPEKIIFNPSRALNGDPEHNLELQEFDVVKIFSRWEMEEMPMVRISGEVQKPGEYRLFKNMTVRDLLILAGNPKLTAYMKNADITRIKKAGESVTSYSININLEEALKDNPQHNIKLDQFDELTVRKIPNWAEETERYVTLKGEFRFPGKYQIFKGEKLSSVIERAGGFTDKAYLRAAKFTRVSVQELQQKRMDEMIAKAEQEIVTKQARVASVSSSQEELDATKSALEGLQRSVGLLKTVKAEGRLVIHMSNLNKFKGTPYDVELLGGDILDIPQKPNAINVLGQVYNPTSIIPTGDADVAFYLAKAGGPTREAEEDDIYVVRVDGTVLSRQQVSFISGLFSTGFMSTILGPGDTIIVPQNFEKIAWMRELKDITSILANVALTAGVMVAAGL